MGAWGIGHWLVVAIVVLVLFGGRGKITNIMGDFASGIKAFKKGLAEDDDAKQTAEMKPLEQSAPKVEKTAQKV